MNGEEIVRTIRNRNDKDNDSNIGMDIMFAIQLGGILGLTVIRLINILS